MSKLKVGDRVRILNIYGIYDISGFGTNASMSEYIGKTTYVTKVSRDITLNIDGGMWRWGRYWLEEIKD